MIPGYVKIMMFLLIVLAIHFGRKQLIDMKHPYKDLEIIGTWDYGYSVAFDADEKLVREDKSLFSLEMYTETEIVMNDDGTFRVTIEDYDITGVWEPDEKNSNIFQNKTVQENCRMRIPASASLWMMRVRQSFVILSYLFPFALLCVLHSIWQLSISVEPPLLHAVTWSASISLNL